MKRVGIDVSVLASENKTGIGVYCFNLIDNLLQINKTDKFVLFAVTPLDSSNVNINYFKKYPNVEIKIIRLPVQIFRRMFLLWQKANWPPVEYFIGKVDIFHSFNWFIPPQKSGKSISTFYDLSSVLYSQFHLPQTTQMDRKRFERMSKMADLIITISENSRKEFIKKYGENRVEVIYPASNLDPPALQALRAGIPLRRLADRNDKNRQEYVLFVGTIEPRKNIERLILAFSRQLSAIRHRQKKSDDRRLMTDNLQLVIAGSRGWFSDEIYNLPKKLGIEERVKFLDFVSDEKLISLYKNALCLVYPSFYEGFGIPVLEAMSLGVPVICSNTSSLPEVGGEAVLYVDPNSTEQISNALKKIYTDKRLRSRLIKKGLLQAKKFSWVESARKLNNLYAMIGKEAGKSTT